MNQRRVFDGHPLNILHATRKSEGKLATFRIQMRDITNAWTLEGKYNSCVCVYNLILFLFCFFISWKVKRGEKNKRAFGLGEKSDPI